LENICKATTQQSKGYQQVNRSSSISDTFSQLFYITQQTWTIKEDQGRKLKIFEMAVLRKICGITRRDRRRNVDILKELQMEKGITEYYLHGYSQGRRPRGRPRKRWLDCDCEDLNLTIHQASHLANNTVTWKILSANLLLFPTVREFCKSVRS